MAAKPSATIDETLTCPICLEILDAPKILDCLHRFCTKCLGEAITKCSSKKFGCPVCRQEFVLSSEGVEGMKGDFMMEAILENYKLEKELEQKKKERKCASCDEVRASEAFCPDCGGFLCHDCCGLHETLKVFKTHINAILLEDLQTGNISSHVENLRAVRKAPKCRQHADQILYFNCITCSTLICPVCAPILHKTHDIEEVESAFSRLLRQLQDLLKSREEGFQSIQTSLQKVGELITKIEEESKTHHRQMKEVAQKREDEIIAEKEALIANIEKETKNKLEDLCRFNEDSCKILDIRKATIITYLKGTRDKIQGLVKLNETVIKNACLFNEKSDMWAAILAIPDAIRAFGNGHPKDCPTFPVLNAIEENGVQLYGPPHTGSLSSSPFEKGTWKMKNKFYLKECVEDKWTLSSVCSGEKDCTVFASLCRPGEYSTSKVNLNGPLDESRRTAVIPVDINCKGWTTFHPSYISNILGELIAVGVGNRICLRGRRDTFDNVTIEPVKSQINALATCGPRTIFLRCKVYLAFDNETNLLEVAVGVLGGKQVNAHRVIKITGLKPIRSVDVWQENLLVCDGHSKACALDKDGKCLHEYSCGDIKRIPLAISADRFGSVFVLQKVMMSSVNINCVEEYTFEGKFVTSWTVADNVTLLTTVRCSPHNSGVVVGASNGEITYYQRTEHGEYLTSLMKAEVESQ